MLHLVGSSVLLWVNSWCHILEDSHLRNFIAVKTYDIKHSLNILTDEKAANLLTVSWHSPTTWTETESTTILYGNLTIYQTTRRGIPVHVYVYRHWWEHPVSLYVVALCFISSRFWQQCIVYFTHDYWVSGTLQLSVLMFKTPFCIPSQFSVSRLCSLSVSLIWISTPLRPLRLGPHGHSTICAKDSLIVTRQLNLILGVYTVYLKYSVCPDFPQISI